MRGWTARFTSLALFFSAGVLFASPLWNAWPTGSATNQASAPSYSPTAYSSVCHGAQTITVSTTTVGAKIRYNLTTGATPADPSCSSGTLINATSGTFSAGKWLDTKIKAVAYTSCSDTSTVSSSEYDFSGGDVTDDCSHVGGG